MKDLIINGEAKTPTINFNFQSGKLSISGRSIPENSVEFYEPIISWLDEYKSSNGPALNIDIKLEYFNTSSSKCILDLFKKLEELRETQKEVAIKWYYEEDDEDMEEAGQDFQAIINVPMELISVDSL
jgi:hypothetical protein